MSIEQNLNAILNRADLTITKRPNSASLFNVKESCWDISTKERHIGTVTKLSLKNSSAIYGADEIYKAAMINGVEGYISRDLFVKMKNYDNNHRSR